MHALRSILIPVIGGLILFAGCRGDQPDAKPSENEQMSETTNAGAEPSTPFSMERYAWDNRPLLVFAPSPDDDHYQKQKRIVEEAMDGFRERDMVLIRVFSSEEGTSRAGDRTLSSSEAGDLRDTFDVQPDAFSVLLVGKDTTVKRRSTEPVSAEALFQQIDRMPMRQREMEQQSSDE